MTIRILLVDDHKLFRRGLAALLRAEADFEIVAEAADGAEGIKQAAATQPDVVLLDLHMPGITGIDALASIKEMAPAAQVLMLTVSEDGADLLAALRAGAAGYLLKNIDGEFLTTSIRRAAEGESVISADMLAHLVAGVREPTLVQERVGMALLSPREREIVAHIAHGASNKEIARDLGVAESTVKIHVQHVLRKLNLSSRVQVAVVASAHGVASRGAP
jgi:two-component system, NarL family, nitrate/nitrite response regulator NarL